MCGIALVSASGYYKYLKEKDVRKNKDLHDLSIIKREFDKKKGKIGARTIKMNLESKGIVMNLKKIRRIMRENGLVCMIRRVNKSRVALQKNIENRHVPNLLKRQFKQSIPYRFASTDITYIRYQGRFSFLSVVKDLASSEILVWRLSRHMDLDLVMNTISDLEKYFRDNNLDLSKLLLHSDQGFQYTNIAYYNKLKEIGITQSMSRRGNSVDNAPIESFFGHFKDEIDYNHLNFEQVHNLISAYMLEYNYERKQWSKMRLAPVYYRDYLLNFAKESVHF